MQFYDEKQNMLACIWLNLAHIKSEKKYRKQLKKQLKIYGLTEASISSGEL